MPKYATPDRLMAELMALPLSVNTRCANFYELRFLLRKRIWGGMDREMIKAVYELWLITVDDSFLDPSYDHSFESVVDFKAWG